MGLKGKGSIELARLRRHRRIRKKISGTAERPRLGVFRSNRHIYAQLVDDQTGRVLGATSTLSKEVRDRLKESGKIEAAKIVGGEIAAKAAEMNIKEVVFDRGGYRYHGRVKALAEAAREKGLIF
jgi:large subunit ribosomal protein L18